MKSPLPSDLQEMPSILNKAEGVIAHTRGFLKILCLIKKSKPHSSPTKMQTPQETDNDESVGTGY